MKLKTCSICNKEVPKLWRSNPKTCYYCARRVAQNTPLSQKGSNTNQKKKSRLKPISDKQAEMLKEYRIVRDEYLKEHPTCEICGETPVELHHKKPRAYYLTDVSVFMSVCRFHHELIEREDKWARENGYKLNHL